MDIINAKFMLTIFARDVGPIILIISISNMLKVGGMTHADAAAKWLADNEDVWMPWTSAGM